MGIVDHRQIPSVLLLSRIRWGIVGVAALKFEVQGDS